MRRNDKRFLTVILVLAAIGIAYRLLVHPSRLLVPVLVLGTVFLLYKYPPSSWRRRPRQGRGPHRPAAGRRDKPRTYNKTKFRVIRGNKKDDPPRHH